MLEIGVQPTLWFDWDDVESSFARAKKLGFETIDFGFPQISQEDFENQTSFYQRTAYEDHLKRYHWFRELSLKYGVAISQAHAQFPIWIEDASDAYNEFMLTVIRMLCEFCDIMNCRTLVVHPITRQNKTDEWNINMKLYRAMIPTALKHNVKICLENMFSSKSGRITAGVCADAEEVVRYVDTLNAEAGADVFGFCFDVGHANLVHKEIRNYINTLGHRLTILHIHDNDGQNDLHLAPYTQARLTKTCANALDWEGFILGLKDINYRGTLSFETFRVMNMTPAPLHDAALTYILEVGKYFRARILE